MHFLVMDIRTPASLHLLFFMIVSILSENFLLFAIRNR
jgi:hypothetical protein